MQLLSGLMIPFVGTTLGAAMVFFMRREMNRKLEMLLMGFAAGVMIAASVWSLLIPAIDMAEEQKQIAWVPATVGFVGGIAFLLVLDTLIPHWHLERDEPEGMESTLKKTTMLVLAVTLHNIPEGMSVGVTFAGAMIGDTYPCLFAVRGFLKERLLSMAPCRGWWSRSVLLSRFCWRNRWCRRCPICLLLRPGP